MFDTLFVTLLVVLIAMLVAWMAVDAGDKSKKAIACSDEIPRNAPLWHHIKQKREELQVTSAFHDPLLAVGNGFIVIMLILSLALDTAVPVVCAAVMILPFEALASRKVIAKSHWILNVVRG